MDATLGHTRRNGHRMLLFFTTLAAALLLGIGGGYGLRAWTSSSVAATTVTPAVQTIVHPAPQPLPDRSDVPTRIQPVNHAGDARLGGAR